VPDSRVGVQKLPVLNHPWCPGRRGPPAETPGKDVTWGEMHVGALSAFLAAGCRVVYTPSLRRAVVRYDY
jgi:hypothetical protein